MTHITLAATAVALGATTLAFAAPPMPLTPAEKAAGWVALFDGHSFNNWRGYRRDAAPDKGWTIDDGALHVTAGGGGGDLITEATFADFELVLEFRCAPRANSGIIYRVAETADATWQTGPEFQVLDDGGHNLAPDDAHAAGALYDLAKPSSDKTLNPAGQWNHARIRVSDGIIQHFLNGTKVVEVDTREKAWRDTVAASKFNPYPGFAIQPRGHIALQDHGDDVWFRNIRVRDLDAPLKNEIALFNEHNLDGWLVFPPDDTDHTWTVDHGTLCCTGQPTGYARTLASFDNFVLMLDWRWAVETGKAGNSGVLLRCGSEDKVWPMCIEAQLQSGRAGDFWNLGMELTADADRTNGRNTRAAGNAEHPVGAWNTYEIIVDQGDITLFVNGEKLNHAWNCTTTPGPIALQSEGAPIHFRNIRLAKIRH